MHDRQRRSVTKVLKDKSILPQDSIRNLQRAAQNRLSQPVFSSNSSPKLTQREAKIFGGKLMQMPAAN